jgi:hypothetical protein
VWLRYLLGFDFRATRRAPSRRRGNCRGNLWGCRRAFNNYVVALPTVCAVTHNQSQVVRVYVSGWVEYEIDNPNALADASAFTPDELDPEGKSNLRSVPPAMYRSLAVALLLEVSKKFRFWDAAGRDVPGATFVQSGGVSLTLAPPEQQNPAPRSA